MTHRQHPEFESELKAEGYTRCFCPTRRYIAGELYEGDVLYQKQAAPGYFINVYRLAVPGCGDSGETVIWVPNVQMRCAGTLFTMSLDSWQGGVRGMEDFLADVRRRLDADSGS